MTAQYLYLLIHLVIGSVSIFGYNLHSCGNGHCHKAVNTALKMKGNCKGYPDITICKNDRRWLERMYPDGLASVSDMVFNMCPESKPKSRTINKDHRPINTNTIPRSPDMIFPQFLGGPILRSRSVQKRSLCTSLFFTDVFKWKVDNSDCPCKTEKRSAYVRSTIKYGPGLKYLAWPVQCPISGRFQWKDQVRCQPNKGSSKKTCSTRSTHRMYLVTNVEPDGSFGHCYMFWIPVWYMQLKVDTHCG